MVYFVKMLRNCILLVFLVFILGGSNLSSAENIKCKTNNSGVDTVIGIDIDSSFTYDSELLDNEEENLGRHNHKFFRKVKNSGHRPLFSGFIAIQAKKRQVLIFSSSYSRLLNNLPPPVAG